MAKQAFNLDELYPETQEKILKKAKGEVKEKILASSIDYLLIARRIAIKGSKLLQLIEVNKTKACVIYLNKEQMSELIEFWEGK